MYLRAREDRWIDFSAAEIGCEEDDTLEILSLSKEGQQVLSVGTLVGLALE